MANRAARRQLARSSGRRNGPSTTTPNLSPALSNNPSVNRVNRVLNAQDVLDYNVEIKRTYVEFLGGYIHYRADFPAGWILKVSDPRVSRRDQIHYSIAIIKASAVNSDGSPFFTEEQANSLSPDKIGALVNAILVPNEDEDKDAHEYEHYDEDEDENGDNEDSPLEAAVKVKKSRQTRRPAKKTAPNTN